MKKEYGVLYMIIVVAAIIFGPLLTIASMNTLFGLAIPYAIETWASVVWLTLATFGGVTSAIREK